MSDYEDFELDVQITGDSTGGAEPRVTAVICSKTLIGCPIGPTTSPTETYDSCGCTVSCNCSQNGTCSCNTCSACNSYCGGATNC